MPEVHNKALHVLRSNVPSFLLCVQAQDQCNLLTQKCVCVYVGHHVCVCEHNVQMHACVCTYDAMCCVHTQRLCISFIMTILFCPCSVPSAPLKLRVTDIGPFGFSLVWNPPSSPNGNIKFYQVELFAYNNLDLPAVNPVNVSSTSYNFTGLAPFTGYSVQVCAYTIGCGDIATLNVTTSGGESGNLK